MTVLANWAFSEWFASFLSHCVAQLVKLSSIRRGVFFGLKTEQSGFWHLNISLSFTQCVFFYLSVFLFLCILRDHGSEWLNICNSWLRLEEILWFLLKCFQVNLSRIRWDALLLRWRNQRASVCLSVSLQRVWVERSGAARGDPDVTAPVPIGAVQCRSIPTASLLRRQQDQSWGSCLCVSVWLKSVLQRREWLLLG